MGTPTLIPASRAWRTMEAERVMSSYEELVHEPIRLAVSWLGHPFSLIAAANCRNAQPLVNFLNNSH